jgi:hypothetical protein
MIFKPQHHCDPFSNEINAINKKLGRNFTFDLEIITKIKKQNI